MSDTPATERIAVEALPDRPRRPPLRAVDPPAAPVPIAAPAPQPIYVQRPPTAAELFNAAFAAIAKVLAVRFQLLLALIGAFVLAFAAMQWQSSPGLFVLIAFCCLTVLPLVWLEFSGRPR